MVVAAGEFGFELIHTYLENFLVNDNAVVQFPNISL